LCYAVEDAGLLLRRQWRKARCDRALDGICPSQL